MRRNPSLPVDASAARPGCLRRFLRGLGVLAALGAGLGLAGEAPPAATPRLEAGLPLLKSFSPKDYGAAPSNWAFVQDPRGVMYVGNPDGVLEFDGSRWRLIRVANRTAVFSLAVDGAGNLFVGAQGDFGMLRPGPDGALRFESLLAQVPEEARAFGDVWSAFCTPQGVVFRTFTHLFRYADGRIQVWRPETSFHKSFFVGGRLFVREVDRGLKELVGSELSLVPGGERFAQEKVDAMVPLPAVRAGAAGPILVGTRTQGLFRLDEGGVRPEPCALDAELRAAQIYDGIRMADGSLALATLRRGVFLLDAAGRPRAHLDAASGLSDSTVYALYEDRQGGLWMGLGSGLARAETGSPMTRFSERSGLPGVVLAVARHQGILYAGTSQGLFRLDPDGGPRFLPVPGVLGQTRAFLGRGAALLVANQHGVYELRDGRPALVLPSAQSAFALLECGGAGRILVGLQDGLAELRWKDGRWRPEGRLPGIPDEVRSLALGADGRVWAGTGTGGVLRITLPAAEAAQAGLGVERMGAAEGLPDIVDIRVFPYGGRTLFSTRRGLYGFIEVERRFVPEPWFAGLAPGPPRWALGMREDPAGGLWMHLAGESKPALLTGRVSRDGGGVQRWQPSMPIPVDAADSDLSIWADPGGTVWFGGLLDGLLRLDTTAPQDTRRAFRALVRRVAYQDGTLVSAGGDAATPPSLPHRDGALRFEFSAATFDRPEATLFQVMLEGADRDWTPWSSEIYRDYTNLREGRYRFRVRARNAYGAESGEGGFAFRVRPPAWRSPWALGAYTAGFGLLLWASHRARVRLLQRRNRVLKAQVAAATAALEQEKRSLEAANARLVTLDQTKGRMLDIVAHDLRSPISVVLLETELLSGSPEVEASAANIRQSAHRMQELVQRFLDLESIERGGMALNIQAVDTLPLLREALEGQRGKARAKGLDLRIDAPVEPLPPLRADPMILREVLENLVSNAIKFSPPGPPARSVTLAAGPGWFSVQDEGPGFTEADKAKAFEEFARLSARPTGGESSSGLGLAIVRSLVHNLQGSIELESAEGEGALFRVHLPLWTG